MGFGAGRFIKGFTRSYTGCTRSYEALEGLIWSYKALYGLAMSVQGSTCVCPDLDAIAAVASVHEAQFPCKGLQRAAALLINKIVYMIISKRLL